MASAKHLPRALKERNAMITNDPIGHRRKSAAIHHPAEAIAVKPACCAQDFEAFLADGGMLGSVKATAIKRVRVCRLRQAMNDQGLTTMDLAKRMKTSRSQLDRMLDPQVKAVRLDVLIRAAHCLGRTCTLTLD
jgi:antitoxin HicB